MREIHGEAAHRNTWPELVIKCSRQFRKRVTVTFCNCRTPRGFQFLVATPAMRGGCGDLHTLCFVCDAHTGRRWHYEIRSPRESRCSPLFLSTPLSNVVINELRPSLERRYEFHVSPNPGSLSSLMDGALEICNIVSSRFGSSLNCRDVAPF